MERYDDLPEDMNISVANKTKFRLAFEMTMDRKYRGIKGKNIHELFYEYSKAHTFEIPIQPEFLMPLINPYHNNFQNFVNEI